MSTALVTIFPSSLVSIRVLIIGAMNLGPIPNPMRPGLHFSYLVVHCKFRLIVLVIATMTSRRAVRRLPRWAPCVLFDLALIMLTIPVLVLSVVPPRLLTVRCMVLTLVFRNLRQLYDLEGLRL